MNEEQLLLLLQSGDYTKVNQAFVYIEKELEGPPSQKLARKLIALCSDRDPDIRAEAIRAAGFFCQLPEVFPVLLGILTHPHEDDLVLDAAVFAVSQMAQNNPDLRGTALTLLAEVALNASMPAMVQKSAYTLALRGAGRISMDTFAKLSASSDVVINRESMHSLCRKDGE
jgi:HEAT repeat protein